MPEPLPDPKDLKPPTECDFFDKSGFCKLDGRPCPYSADTFVKCPKYQHAISHPEDVNQVMENKLNEKHYDDEQPGDRGRDGALNTNYYRRKQATDTAKDDAKFSKNHPHLDKIKAVHNVVHKWNHAMNNYGMGECVMCGRMQESGMFCSELCLAEAEKTVFENNNWAHFQDPMYEHRIQQDEAFVNCPQCNESPIVMGKLLEHMWYRCESCGFDFTDTMLEGKNDDDEYIRQLKKMSPPSLSRKKLNLDSSEVEDLERQISKFSPPTGKSIDDAEWVDHPDTGYSVKSGHATYWKKKKEKKTEGFIAKDADGNLSGNLWDRPTWNYANGYSWADHKGHRGVVINGGEWAVYNQANEHIDPVVSGYAPDTGRGKDEVEKYLSGLKESSASMYAGLNAGRHTDWGAMNRQMDREAAARKREKAAKKAKAHADGTDLSGRIKSAVGAVKNLFHHESTAFDKLVNKIVEGNIDDAPWTDHPDTGYSVKSGDATYWKKPSSNWAKVPDDHPDAWVLRKYGGHNPSPYEVDNWEPGAIEAWQRLRKQGLI